MIYSYKGNTPTALPDRIRLSNGSTRTDRSTFTDDEIADAGYILIDLYPTDVDPLSERVIWNSNTIKWEKIVLSDGEKVQLLNNKWNAIREERNLYLKESDILVLRELEHEAVISEKLKTYRQELRDITLQTDPYNIAWPSLTTTEL